MKTRILMAFIMCLMGTCFAQPPDSLWSQRYGSGRSNTFSSVLKTTGGGYILAGTTNADFWLVKANSTGETEWEYTYGESEIDEYCNAVQPTRDGGYIMAGRSEHVLETRSDFWLVKTNSEGNMEWSASYDRGMYEYANSVLQTDDGGYIVAGSTWDPGLGDIDFWVVRTNPQGLEEWRRTYGGSHPDECNCIQQTSDGGYVLAGSTGIQGTQSEVRYFALIKINSGGDTLWTRTYHDWSYNECSSVKQTMDGGYILTGTTYRDMDPYMGLVVKADANGEQQWSRRIHNIDYGKTSVLQTTDGGFVMAGTTYNDKFCLSKTDANGDSLWSCIFGGTVREYFSSMLQTTDGGFALAGYCSPLGMDSSFAILLKTSPDPMAADQHFVLHPSAFILSSFPNPFNPGTTLRFSVPQVSPVTLDVFDLQGRKVECLFSGTAQAGEHQVRFDGSALPSGMYFSRLQAGGQVVQRKLLLLK